MHEIYPQSQLTPTSCVPACISMYTGIDQQKIIDQMKEHGDSTGGLHCEFRQWVRMGYLPRTLPYPDLILGYKKVFLLTVPSLNIKGGNHRILIDYQENLKVYDPNDGIPGKLVYNYDLLNSWSELTVVEFCGK